MKKRLLQNLPFWNFRIWDVFTFNWCSSFLYIDKWQTLYSWWWCSDNWFDYIEMDEKKIITAIWDNPDWFSDVELKELKFNVSTNKIVIDFDSLDLWQAQTLAKWLQEVIEDNFCNEKYKNFVWRKFWWFTISLK